MFFSIVREEKIEFSILYYIIKYNNYNRNYDLCPLKITDELG
jgi:hypothetical protein